MQVKQSRRSAFTLVEVLVVISIIALLVALTTGAAFRVFGTSQKKVTIADLEKLQTKLKQQWTAVIDTARKESIPTGVKNWAGGDISRARVIWTKLRLKQQFPQNYAEAVNPAGSNNPYVSSSDLRPNPRYVEVVRQSINSGKQSSGEVQSATLLLAALKLTRRGGVSSLQDTDLSPEAIKDTNGDGVPELVDAWGNPFVLFRWGVGNQKLDAQGEGEDPNRLDRDTEDPDHTLMDVNWNNSDDPRAQAFEGYLHPISLNINGQRARRSWYTEPTIISYGPDGQSGLGAWMSVPPASTQATDNLFSFEYR